MGIVWLSHILEEEMPLYGGDRLSILPGKSILGGDSCNTLYLKLPNHTGSHVDVPYHFLVAGKKIDELPPEEFVYNYPVWLDVQAAPGELLIGDLFPFHQLPEDKVDLVLIRTGFERFRSLPTYWQESPGLAVELMEKIFSSFPNIKGLGVDLISISSPAHRKEGRRVHRYILSRGVLIFEDLRLSPLHGQSQLVKVIALPLRIAGGDGAPCTVLGFME